MRETVHLLAAAMAALLLCLLAGCAGGGQQQEAQRQPTSISATSIQPTEHSTANAGTTADTTSRADAQVTDQIPGCSGLDTFTDPTLYVPKISNGKIAFARKPSLRDANYEIYVMNADGTSRSRLTNTPALEFTPTLSPDGKKIAFVSNRDGDFDDYRLYMMNADGSSQTRLTSELRVDLVGPAFSPDGEKLTFIGSRGDDHNYLSLYVMNADGTGLTRLANNAV